MQSQAEVKDAFRLLLIATAVTVALWFIPFAWVVTYPFRIFVTLIHETGHALATLATFGSVNRIQLAWNGSGVTETAGGVRLFISSAGYLSTTLFGAALLLVLRRERNARAAAMATAMMVLAVTLFFAGNLLAWLAGLAIGVGMLLLALKAKPRIVHFFMSFLAIQLVLNAFFDLLNLMYLSAFEPGRLTDAQNMANATGGFVPAIVWAVGWSLLSILILAVTLVVYYRSLRQRAALAAAPPPPLITDRSQAAADRGL
jgi:hypothetical protein